MFNLCIAGAFLKAFKDCPEFFLQIGKCFSAGRFRVALFEKRFDCILGAPGVIERVGERHGGHSLKDGCADRLRMAAHINECDPGSVRATDEVDFFISQRLADFIEVIHSAGRGVLSQVILLIQLLKAGPEHLGIEHVLEISLEILIASCEQALKIVVASSAALVDKNNIPVLAHP